MIFSFIAGFTECLLCMKYHGGCFIDHLICTRVKEDDTYSTDRRVGLNIELFQPCSWKGADPTTKTRSIGPWPSWSSLFSPPPWEPCVHCQVQLRKVWVRKALHSALVSCLPSPSLSTGLGRSHCRVLNGLAHWMWHRGCLSWNKLGLGI